MQLVVISGLVWNWPTSSAWAARVYVNDRYTPSAHLLHISWSVLRSKSGEVTVPW